MNDKARAAEVAEKIASVQGWLGEGRAARLRGIDWFAWITAGGRGEVLLAAETGIAEVVVTRSGAWVVTDEIEAQRLADEEIPDGSFSVRATSWARPAERETAVSELTRGREIVSDRPLPGEGHLPGEMVAAKRTLNAAEVERYRRVGALAAEAMAATLREAAPEWSEGRLAGAGAAALLERGLDPGLIMAAGERRMQLYRHPITGKDPIGNMAMLVFCARGYGLWANLTRFVSFTPVPSPWRELHRQVREVEARALELSTPGVELRSVYEALAKAYAQTGHPFAIRQHHQGGTTGYLSREVIANPEATQMIGVGTAVAWNPSLPGAKVEDTFLVTESGLENLTMAEGWPTVNVAGVERPLVLER